MAGLTDYAENLVLNALFRAGSISIATVYVGLFTAAPSDAGGGTEASGGSYARVAATFSAPSPAGTITNSGTVTFPTASGSWGALTHFAVFDAVSGGNMIGWAPLTTPKTVGSGDTASYAASALTIILD